MYQQFYGDQSRNNRKNSIQVTGNGKVSVRPNKAEVTLGVSDEDQQLKIAQSNVSSSMIKIKAGLNEMGISDEYIQTADYSITPTYDYVDGKQIFRGYTVQHLLQVTINNIEETGESIDKAVSNGANLITGIHFTSSNNEQYMHQALSMAVINAYHKAETIAQTIGVQLQKEPVLVIENNQQDSRPLPFQATTFAKSEAATTIQPGSIDIASNITAKFIFH
ncbi:uncharacterized protein YggE [Cytobacillus eiseniae]|uniref:Uncharacterized protein YggE n=1 Tax=Cytobacillus eiseniae TaxID=762947 RepID=A0ABS4REN6_9BACI|nr:SIMPL domain-containing protein [Cytobacillus eiseniae]MBP2240836.1 uncharacterized protein YggE [Cytobacillus eiseniae]